MINKDRIVPISIILAGIIISGSILHSRDISLPFLNRSEISTTESITGISPIKENEPVLGNPKARIIFIEYSDAECPFSSEFSREREKIMSSYGAEGKVAWIYRSTPAINVSSLLKAISLECVAEREEGYKFWTYLRRIENKNIISAEDGTPNIEPLIEAAIEEGIPPENVRECIENQHYIKKVRNNIKEAVAEGAESTPFTVILLPFEISPSQREQITSNIQDTQAGKVTIPTKSDRILLDGFIAAEEIGSIIETVLSFY